MGARRTLLNKWPFMAFEFNVAHFRQKKDKSHYTFIRSRIIRINFSVKLTEPEDAVDIDNTILYKFQYQIPKYQTHKNTTYRAEKLIVPQTHWQRQVNSSTHILTYNCHCNVVIQRLCQWNIHTSAGNKLLFPNVKNLVFTAKLYWHRQSTGSLTVTDYTNTIFGIYGHKIDNVGKRATFTYKNIYQRTVWCLSHSHAH